jgi:hypothetical protein
VGIGITVLLYLAMVSLCGGFGMKKCFSHSWTWKSDGLE